MRVLQVLLHEGVGGMETLASRLEHLFQQRGVYARSHALDVGSPHAGVTSTRLRRLLDLREAMRAVRPDAVIAHSALPALYARILPKSAPIITVVHSPGDEYVRGLIARAEELICLRSEAIVFVSKSAMAKYGHAFPVAANRLHWIPNGVPIPPTPNLRAPRLPLKFVAVSRLVPSKDLRSAILGFGEYSKAYPGATLRVVGDAADEAYFKELAQLVSASPVLRDRVMLLGRRADVGAIMDDADMLIHASHYESQGIVLAEAAVRGLPTVVTRSVREGMWWHSQSLSFEKGDWRDLGRVLLNYASSPDLGGDADSVQRARRELDENVAADRYLELIRSLQTGH